MFDDELAPGAMWSEMASRLSRLPLGHLTATELLTDEFKLAKEGPLEVYWAPVERLNRAAKIAVVGLTPGYAQMKIAFEAARKAIERRLQRREVLTLAKRDAAFAGSMRTNLGGMLDAIGVADMLQIPSTEELFAGHDSLVHTTSALRYPVFVNGQNYGGGKPPVSGSQLLRSYVTDFLSPELQALSGALLVPLGKAATRCVESLIQAGAISRDRCLLGFPHPSGGNGHRVRQFEANRDYLTSTVRSWSKTS